MKRVALISSFCDSEEKLNILRDNIKILKSNGLDIILLSPIPLPEEIIKLCDFSFFTKENPLLTWPFKVQIYKAFFYMPQNNDFLCINLCDDDYGWAGLYQIKKLTEIALTFDYDYFYNLIYDLHIDENVLRILNNPQESLVCGYKRGNTLHSLVSLHFMVFNRENCKKLVDHLSLEKYLDFLNSYMATSGKVAETFFEILSRESGYKISNFFVKDKISNNPNFFNFSNIDDIKFFIEKNANNVLSDVRVYTFENQKKINAEIIVNDKVVNISEEYQIFSLGFSYLEIESIFLRIENQIIDLMETLNKLSHSFISFESTIE